MSICCTFCSAEEAKFKCSRCNIARYCNKECQSQNWKSHKIICVPNKAGSGDKKKTPKVRGNVGVGEERNNPPMQSDDFLFSIGGQNFGLNDLAGAIINRNNKDYRGPQGERYI